MSIFRSIVTIQLLVVLLIISQEATANSREDAIKSGFLYNFARYSEGAWFNAAIQSNYHICSFNPDFIMTASNTLKDLTIETRPVILTLLTIDKIDIVDCNTLFISKADDELWHSLINKTNLSALMLVGETEGFIQSGGQINFFIVSGKVRFEIDPEKLRASGINMSSKVLRLGRIYEGAL